MQGLEESEILAQAVREGIRVLFQDAIVENYLNGNITRKAVIEKLGYEKVQRIDFQRDVIKKDIAWGLSDE